MEVRLLCVNCRGCLVWYNNGLLGIAAQCWIAHETLKQEHTIQNHNTPVTQIIQWLCEVFQTVGQERFLELICAGSDWEKRLGISQAADSVTDGKVYLYQDPSVSKRLSSRGRSGKPRPVDTRWTCVWLDTQEPLLDGHRQQPHWRPCRATWRQRRTTDEEDSDQHEPWWAKSHCCWPSRHTEVML